jgi:hypothetical protein
MIAGLNSGYRRQDLGGTAPQPADPGDPGRAQRIYPIIESGN